MEGISLSKTVQVVFGFYTNLTQKTYIMLLATKSIPDTRPLVADWLEKGPQSPLQQPCGCFHSGSQPGRLWPFSFPDLVVH